MMRQRFKPSIELDRYSKAAFVVGILLTVMLGVFAVDYDSLQIGLAFTLSFALLSGGWLLGRLGKQRKAKQTNQRGQSAVLWWAGLLLVFGFADAFVPLAFGFAASATYLSTLGSAALFQVGAILVVVNGISESSFFPYGIGNAVLSLGPGVGAFTAIFTVGFSAMLYHLADVPIGPGLVVIFIAFSAMEFVGLITGKLWVVLIAHVSNNAAVFGYSVLVLSTVPALAIHP